MEAEFTFEHGWLARAPADAAYAVLADVDAYPLWWREIRSITRQADDRGHARVRSVLPYALSLTVIRDIEDPVCRVLRVRLEGDLVGWAEFVVAGLGESGPCRVEYRQEVVLGGSALKWTHERCGRVARPLLRANHAAMMRSCRRGLNRRLAHLEGS